MDWREVALNNCTWQSLVKKINYCYPIRIIASSYIVANSSKLISPSRTSWAYISCPGSQNILDKTLRVSLKLIFSCFISQWISSYTVCAMDWMFRLTMSYFNFALHGPSSPSLLAGLLPHSFQFTSFCPREDWWCATGLCIEIVVHNTSLARSGHYS